MACVGETEVLVPAAPARENSARQVCEFDWLAFMSQPLRRSWDALQELRSQEGIDFLNKATFADWEEFCLRHTRIHPSAVYSRWLSDGI